jgi:hypothetical protein
LKYAIPIEVDSLDAPISLKFARSRFFAIIEKTNLHFEIIENSYYGQKSGAGKSIFNYLIGEKKVNALIAFELGLIIQQMAYKEKVQLIILSEKNESLKHIRELMKVSKDSILNNYLA